MLYFGIVFLAGLLHNFFEYYLINSIMNWEKLQIFFSSLLICLYSYCSIYYIMYYPNLAHFGANLYIISMAIGKFCYFMHFKYKILIKTIFNRMGICKEDLGKSLVDTSIPVNQISEELNEITNKSLNSNDIVNRWGEE